jgi:undecaprenyl diphosphate synthase
VTQAEQLAFINQHKDKMPGHIAIIMDGNGRWAKQRGLQRVQGHQEGIKSVREIVETAGELGIKALTLYTFSVENWRRPKWEVTALMQLLVRTLRLEIESLIEKDVRMTISGQLEDLPPDVAREMREGVDKTASNKGLILNLALSYSARQEILNAVQNIARKAANKELDPATIDAKVFSAHLSTAHLDDPDLLIRTSGEYRLSNFLLWQLAYTEIFVTEKLWPDFRKEPFYEAIINYMQRERRFGKVSEQLEKTTQ